MHSTIITALLLYPTALGFSPLQTQPLQRVRLFATPLPTTYKETGEALILQAGKECGDDGTQIAVEWKAERIIVTVHGNSYVSDANDSTEDSTEDIRGVDVTELAKTINRFFDDDEVGMAIAENHEIEVTTPGASDMLSGSIMFEAYKGFDIICRFVDPKTKKEKEIDGRLVERNDLFTVINIKGRMKNIKNDNVISVKLPKAKKEKGAR